MPFYLTWQHCISHFEQGLSLIHDYGYCHDLHPKNIIVDPAISKVGAAMRLP
jgi:hypothetical protein